MNYIYSRTLNIVLYKYMILTASSWTSMKSSTIVQLHISKAHQSKFDLKCFVSKDTSFLLHAYYTYIRPILEYNSVIWWPTLKYEIEALEPVQWLGDEHQMTKLELVAMISVMYLATNLAFQQFSASQNRLHLSLKMYRCECIIVIMLNLLFRLILCVF